MIDETEVLMMTMIDILKEVGRGKRGARDLNYSEALAAAESIIDGTATPAQIGAFFVAERMKMESAEELEAFVHVLRERTYRSSAHAGLDCAGPYDGRKSSFYATFATAFLLAAAGVPVTLHGMASLPPKWGVTLMDLLRQKGIDSASVLPDHALMAAKQSGVLLVDAEQWCPPLQALRPLREELGMRTILNTAEKLLDYSHADYIVYGVFHSTVFDRMGQLMETLKYRKALIVQGTEGSEDLFIHRPTRVHLIQDGESHMHMIDPETFGLEATPPDKDWTAAEQLKTAEEVLQGQAHIAFTNQVLLNAAVRLHLCGSADSIEEGIYTCKSLLERGAAWNRYECWHQALRASASSSSSSGSSQSPGSIPSAR